jgi:hypothetical protein
LYIYQSKGRIKRPESIAIDIYLGELNFFQLGAGVTQLFWISEGYQKPDEPPMPKNRLQREIWKLIEHADSSFAARIVACVSVVVIILCRRQVRARGAVFVDTFVR